MSTRKNLTREQHKFLYKLARILKDENISNPHGYFLEPDTMTEVKIKEAIDLVWVQLDRGYYYESQGSVLNELREWYINYKNRI